MWIENTTFRSFEIRKVVFSYFWIFQKYEKLCFGRVKFSSHDQNASFQIFIFEKLRFGRVKFFSHDQNASFQIFIFFVVLTDCDDRRHHVQDHEFRW
jgi:hypothetical protein